jgi:hypothetical protein
MAGLDCSASPSDSSPNSALLAAAWASLWFFFFFAAASSGFSSVFFDFCERSVWSTVYRAEAISGIFVLPTAAVGGNSNFVPFHFSFSRPRREQ